MGGAAPRSVRGAPSGRGPGRGSGRGSGRGRRGRRASVGSGGSRGPVLRRRSWRLQPCSAQGARVSFRHCAASASLSVTSDHSGEL